MPFDISCDRLTLRNAFAIVAKFSPPKSPRDVFMCVRAESYGSTLELTATNGETTAVVKITSGVAIMGTGVTLLPTSRMSSILKEVSGDDVSITDGGEAITIVAGRSKYKMPTTPHDEFPRHQSEQWEKYTTIASGQFRSICRRTLFAADDESTRYALGGIHFTASGGNVVAMASDGRRGSITECQGVTDSGHMIGNEHGTAGAVVPIPALALIDRSIGDSGDVDIAMFGNDFAIRTESLTITTRTLEGRFPDMKRVIPQLSDYHEIKLDEVPGGLDAAVRQAAVVTEKESRGLIIAIGGNELRIEGETASVGKSTIEVPIETGDFQCSNRLDSAYLKDFFNALLPTESASIYFKNERSVVIMRTSSEDWIYMLQPMSLTPIESTPAAKPSKKTRDAEAALA